MYLEQERQMRQLLQFRYLKQDKIGTIKLHQRVQLCVGIKKRITLKLRDLRENHLYQILLVYYFLAWMAMKFSLLR